MSEPRPRLDVAIFEMDPDEANADINRQITEFAAKLPLGSWFDVWYPTSTEADFDVVCVDADGIRTL